MTGIAIGAIAAAILAGIRAASSTRQQPIRVKSKKKQ